MQPAHRILGRVHSGRAEPACADLLPSADDRQTSGHPRGEAGGRDDRDLRPGGGNGSGFARRACLGGLPFIGTARGGRRLVLDLGFRFGARTIRRPFVSEGPSWGAGGTAFLRSAPALKCGTFFAAIVIGSPV